MSKPQTEKLIRALRAQFKESVLQLSEAVTASSQITEAIPTGIETVDKFVLGIGGLPVGRASEVLSEEGGGKTSLAYSALAQAQAAGVAVYLDSEQSFDADRAALFGVDIETLVFAQPKHMEEALDIIVAVLEAHNVKLGPLLIVWDSLAAAPTREEVENGVAPEKGRDNRAAVLSRATRQLASLLAEKRAHLLVVNQIREKRGVMFGNNTTTPGGHAVKYLASVRLQLWSGKAFKAGEDHVGKTITVMALKNRLVPPYRKVRVRLDYALGWNNDWSVLELAKTRKLIDPRAKGEKAVQDARAALWSDSGAGVSPVEAVEGVDPGDEPVDSAFDDGGAEVDDTNAAD